MARKSWITDGEKCIIHRPASRGITIMKLSPFHGINLKKNNYFMLGVETIIT